jgi:uncharacterized protein (TIGR00730 family)
VNAPSSSVALPRAVCVFCGSSPGSSVRFTEAAEELGEVLAAGGVDLVYGGGNIGLMGSVARAVLRSGGQVTGIIPRFLVEREVMLSDVQELVVTEDMHERKRLMFERSEAFVALPGGIGTLEELIEQMTWAQLGRHKKPIVLVNLDGFWDPLCVLLEHMKQFGFVRDSHRIPFVVVDTVGEVLPAIGDALAAAQRAPEPVEPAEPVTRF